MKITVQNSISIYGSNYSWKTTDKKQKIWYSLLVENETLCMNRNRNKFEADNSFFVSNTSTTNINQYIHHSCNILLFNHYTHNSSLHAKHHSIGYISNSKLLQHEDSFQCSFVFLLGRHCPRKFLEDRLHKNKTRQFSHILNESVAYENMILECFFTQKEINLSPCSW